MKAFLINKYDKKAPLFPAEVATPVIKDDEILVAICANGLNLLDSKIKSGEFKLFMPYKLPLILGHDVAGVVTQVGENVKQFKAGDQVHGRSVTTHFRSPRSFVNVNSRSAYHSSYLFMRVVIEMYVVPGARFHPLMQPGRKPI